MSFSVIEPGLQSRIVDFGRLSSRSLGVPVGGAADRWSLALGNALVGNSPDAPALEMTLTGPTLRAEAQIGGVLFGARFDLELNGSSETSGKTFTIQPGEILRVRGTSKGMRAYLCVPGGFVSPRILNSRSSLEPIQAGQTLVCTPSSLPSRFLADSANRTLPAQFPHVLHVLPGSQADWFAPDTISSRVFAVSGDSNRMGLRLKGEPIARLQREMISEPVCPGVIQVANDGQCIILGVDGQTIGGYPKIAQVIRADLDYLGQLRPGDAIRFVPINLEEAENVDRRRMAELRQWLAWLAVAVN